MPARKLCIITNTQPNQFIKNKLAADYGIDILHPTDELDTERYKKVLFANHHGVGGAWMYFENDGSFQRFLPQAQRLYREDKLILANVCFMNDERVPSLKKCKTTQRGLAFITNVQKVDKQITSQEFNHLLNTGEVLPSMQEKLGIAQNNTLKMVIVGILLAAGAIYGLGIATASTAMLLTLGVIGCALAISQWQTPEPINRDDAPPPNVPVRENQDEPRNENGRHDRYNLRNRHAHQNEYEHEERRHYQRIRRF